MTQEVRRSSLKLVNINKQQTETLIKLARGLLGGNRELTLSSKGDGPPWKISDDLTAYLPDNVTASISRHGDGFKLKFNDPKITVKARAWIVKKSGTLLSITFNPGLIHIAVDGLPDQEYEPRDERTQTQEPEPE